MWLILNTILENSIAVTSNKGKKEKYFFCRLVLSLVKYSDLLRCLHNDFGRSVILFDDANNVHWFI
jgi:hypothetical protein